MSIFMSKKLSLPFRKSLKIIGFTSCNKADQQQLMKMGMTPGTHFTLIRTAPLGDPVEICIRNTRLALSKAMIQQLAIEIA
jgi:Fe2+ transport system protein FeoA